MFMNDREETTFNLILQNEEQQKNCSSIACAQAGDQKIADNNLGGEKKKLDSFCSGFGKSRLMFSYCTGTTKCFLVH